MADAPSLSEAGAQLSRSAGLRIDDWQAWVAAVTQPAVLADVAAVAACCLAAWAIAYVLRARTRNEARSCAQRVGDAPRQQAACRHRRHVRQHRWLGHCGDPGLPVVDAQPGAAGQPGARLTQRGSVRHVGSRLSMKA